MLVLCFSHSLELEGPSLDLCRLVCQGFPPGSGSVVYHCENVRTEKRCILPCGRREPNIA